ncbi:MAG: hypothetical protein HUJ65_01695 [Oscillospiraceae bacterium]|nr:hypothetical protein [Oscillospiraceae bacterium]
MIKSRIINTLKQLDETDISLLAALTPTELLWLGFVTNSSGISYDASSGKLIIRTVDEASLIRASASYRIGRFITLIPRKIRGGIRCYKEHGMRYTVENLKCKIKRLLGGK